MCLENYPFFQEFGRYLFFLFHFFLSLFDKIFGVTCMAAKLSIPYKAYTRILFLSLFFSHFVNSLPFRFWRLPFLSSFSFFLSFCPLPTHWLGYSWIPFLVRPLIFKFFFKDLMLHFVCFWNWVFDAFSSFCLC